MLELQGVRRYFFCNIQKTEEEIIKKTDEGFFERAWDFVDSDEGAAALFIILKMKLKMKIHQYLRRELQRQTI
jgi:ribosome-associated toxin RatA of RatAB toxin-antitoxin module